MDTRTHPLYILAWTCLAFTMAGGLLASAAPASPRSAPDSNLIRNPGFETDQNGDGLPDHWTFSWESTHRTDSNCGVAKQEPDWAWDKEIKHSGQASVRCGVARPDDDGVWTQDGIAIPAGVKYLKITAWIRSQNVKNGMGSVGCVFLGENSQFLHADYTAIAADRDREWTQYTGCVDVPKGARTLRIRAWVNFRYAGTGTFWFDDLAAVPVDKTVPSKGIYADPTPAPEPTAEERDRGFILFTRNCLRLLFPNSHPEPNERVSQLAIRACPGEREPAVLAVHALRPLPNVRVSVSDLKGPSGAIPSASVDVRSVRYLVRNGQSRWGPYNEMPLEVPLFLEERDRLEIAADRTQPYWLTVHVPEEIAPGTYEGAAMIHSDGAAPFQLPLWVEVYPFRLAEPRGAFFAMYERQRSDPQWIAESFADMRAHGMTGVALYGACGLALTVQDQKPIITWNGQSAMEREMDAYVRAGFPEPPVWLMARDIPAFCEKIGPVDSAQYAEAFRQIILQINAHAKAAGWPEIIYQPVDEPFEHSDRRALALRLLSILKDIPGVRTEEDGMNAGWRSFFPDAYALTDVLVLHNGPTLRRGHIDVDEWQTFHAKAVADGKTIWFYNIDLTAWHPEPMRFMAGFGLWKSKAAGIVEWSYMGPVTEDDPSKAYTQSDALLYRFPKAPGESGGPTIGYEAMREGVDDYRYLLTLSRLVEKAKKSGSPQAARQAEELWAPIQAKLDQATFNSCMGSAMQGNWTGPCEMLPDGNRSVSGDHKIDNNWQFKDYDALRRQIAQGILRLMEKDETLSADRTADTHR